MINNSKKNLDVLDSISQISQTAGAILGFRYWFVDKKNDSQKGNYLISPYRRDSWKSYIRRTPRISSRNSKGLYAYHNFSYSFPIPEYGEQIIKGLVVGSGQTYIYKHGFRSERMQILVIAEEKQDCCEFCRPPVELNSLIKIKEKDQILFLPEDDMIELAFRLGEKDEFCLFNQDIQKNFFYSELNKDS